jgi:hypothetical protein
MARNRDAGYVSGYPVVVAYAETYGTATGGTSSTITVGGESYTLLTFASDANLAQAAMVHQVALAVVLAVAVAT